MKISNLIIGLVCLSVMSSPAQNASGSASANQPTLPEPTEYRIVDQGANHRVWQWETDEKLPDGTIIPHVHSYTELASGLNYQGTNGQWMESQELIEAFPAGAVARQGQYQVIFANDLNSAGSVDMQTPDGKRLRSNILGLMYVDTATGDAVMIAEVQDSAGELISSNQVLYPNAFDGVKADVQYTYKRGSFEQDVILLEQPPTPESLGMNPDTTELEVVTEFVDPPDANIQDTTSSEPGLEADENINWGVVNLGHGKAFDLGSDGAPAPVAKRYVTIQGRQFLLEKVRIKDIQASLSKLPDQASNSKRLPVMALAKLAMPKTPSARREAGPMRLASTIPPDKGYVLDYVTLNATFTNYTFRADTTYYISGTATLVWGATFEGGTVIKYAHASTGINCFDGIYCTTSPYRPAIFTAADDNSVGEPISGSSGSPSGTYASTYLVVYCPSCSVDLEYLRFSYASVAVELYDSTDNYLHNIQFYGNGNAFYLLQNASIENCLFEKSIPVSGSSIAVVGMVNCTAHNVSQLNGGVILSVTNSLLIGVTNLGPSFTSINNYTNLYDAGIFQIAGAGNDYLAASSPFRGTGLTNNLSSALLASLKIKTTYVPTILSNVTYSANATLSPQATRDTNATDLGYHYDPLDYLTYNCAVTNNAVLTITNGTAIANYNTNGIWLQDGSSLVSTGTPLNPNWLVRYQSVQEQPVLLGGSSPSAGVPVGSYHFNNAAPSAIFRFNKFTCPAGGGCDVYHISFPYNFTNLLVQDCEFWSGANYVGGGTNSVTLLKNNLFWRTPFVATSTASNSLSLSNNLFVLVSSKIQITQPTGSVWNAFNNMFDTCWIDSAARCTNGYNAYYTSTNRITPTSSHDIVSSSAFSYSSGTLGNYYQFSSSSLVNHGSTNAAVAGLYHYTTQTNQKKETNSVVDIGYHYVALDTNGLPFDTYWIGISDYLMNADGDSTLPAWLMKYFGHLGIDPNGDYDGDGTNNLQRFLNGADPNIISFSFSVTNQYVTTNIVNAAVTILGGVPASFSVLLDSSNFPSATWTAYGSSNITVNITTNQGSHDVWIGLRGLPTDAHQTWEETTLVLDSAPPIISITNPVNNTSFNSSRVNIGGYFRSASIKQITVNDVSAFVSGTNFEALNVSLGAGTNLITALVANFAGVTNTAAINIITTTNTDGSLNNPVTLSASPVAGFVPLPVAFSMHANVPGTLQRVDYDFNGDDLVDFTTNTTGSITYSYATNGEYFPLVTVQTSVGRFSSVGGWNAVALDDTNLPIRINVQSNVTMTTFASVTDPVDLKWVAPSNLYVLSRSTHTLTEFGTNGSSIRSVNTLGANPTGFDVDASGNVYVAVTGSNQVWKLQPSGGSYVKVTGFGVGGSIGLTNGTTGTDSGTFNAPFDVAVSPDGGTLSVSDSGNHRIQQFAAATGGFIDTFGSYGSDVGQFNTPKGLTYDSVGTLYVVDSGNNRMVMAESPTVLGVTGSGGTALGQFSGPVNLSVGERGVYVADTGNNRIQKFDAPDQGLFTITPSSIRYAFSTNFSLPYSLAAVNDLTNDLFYVADTGNNRVVLCRAPNNDANDIMSVWNNMVTHAVAGDIPGAILNFCGDTADNYRQSYFNVGTSDLASDIGQIGALTQVFIKDDTAQCYFEHDFEGHTILFPVEFMKENGLWKIISF